MLNVDRAGLADTVCTDINHIPRQKDLHEISRLCLTDKEFYLGLCFETKGLLIEKATEFQQANLFTLRKQGCRCYHEMIPPCRVSCCRGEQAAVDDAVQMPLRE